MRLNALTHGALRIMLACMQRPSMSMAQTVQTLGLTEPLVVKSCHQLMHASYLKGQRGRGGGYSLARPAHHINVMEIIDVFEGAHGLFPCRLNQESECLIASICRLILACEAAFLAFRTHLASINLADLDQNTVMSL